jgi:hypothetical protein
MSKTTSMNKLGKYKETINTYTYVHGKKPFAEAGFESGTYGGWKNKLKLAAQFCQILLKKEGYKIFSEVTQHTLGFTIPSVVDKAKKDYLDSTRRNDKSSRVELSRDVLAAKVHMHSILALHTLETEHVVEAIELWTLFKIFHIHEKTANSHPTPNKKTEIFDTLAKILVDRTDGASFKVAWLYLFSNTEVISEEITEILDIVVIIEDEDTAGPEDGRRIAIKGDLVCPPMKKTSFGKNYYSKFRKVLKSTI